jgi:hypothetical protein
MIARFRWMKVSPLTRSQLAKVANAMQQRPYGREVKSGYSLTTVRADFIEGTFTERLDYVEKIPDPLGGELSVSRVEFRRTEFRVGTAFPQIEFRNPARQVRPIINLIANCLDFQVAIVSVAPSPLAWAKALSNLGKPIQVLRIRSTQFSLSNEAQASVLVNGTTDVRPLLPTLLGNRRIEAEAIVCGWGNDSGRWLVELRATGCANVFASQAGNPSLVLRKALASLPFD